MRDHKNVLVTGASSGIGQATAAALAARGHHVFAVGRRVERLEQLAAEHDGIEPFGMDVTDTESVAATVQEIERAGHIDVLINNAGTAVIGPVEAVSDQDARAQFDTNVFGLLNVTRAVLPGMRARGSGRLINISSVVGRTTFPGTGVYCASKHAVEALSDALRAELRSFGIDVAIIEPGFVRSEINTGAASVAGVAGDYRKLANATESYMSREVSKGADPADLAKLIVRVAEARKVKSRYLFPATSKALLAIFNRTPDRIADTMKLKTMKAT